MSASKIYTEQQENELRVVAKSDRKKWREKLLELVGKWGMEYNNVYAKTDSIARKMGLPSTGPHAKTAKLGHQTRRNLKRDGVPESPRKKPRKSYYKRKHHDPPSGTRVLNVSSNEVRFNVKGIRFETGNEGLQLVVHI